MYNYIYIYIWPCRVFSSVSFLQAALLEAEQGNEPVDGGLLGMAAAQVAPGGTWWDLAAAEVDGSGAYMFSYKT